MPADSQTMLSSFQNKSTFHAGRIFILILHKGENHPYWLH